MIHTNVSKKRSTSLASFDIGTVASDLDSSSRQNRSLDRNDEIKSYPTRAIDVWALGITIVLGGQYFNWNIGLEAGFGSYAIAVSLIGVGYFCLCLCTSEISSTLPFAGTTDGI